MGKDKDTYHIELDVIDFEITDKEIKEHLDIPKNARIVKHPAMPREDSQALFNLYRQARSRSEYYELAQEYFQRKKERKNHGLFRIESNGNQDTYAGI